MRTGALRPNLLIAVLLLAAGMAGAPGAAQAATCEATAAYGALFTTSDVTNAVKALPAEALLGKRGKPVESPPSQYMLNNLPTVAQQGTAAEPGFPGTCEAQAYGYGLGSYTTARSYTGERKWPADQAQYSNSAAYLYALIQKRSGRRCPEGSRSLDYLEQLVSDGAPSRVQIGYQPNCTYLDGINTGPLPNMTRFRIGSYAVIPVDGNANAVTQIKSQVMTQHAVAFTGRVLCGYAKQPEFKSGVIYETATVPDSGHGQLIVGYDDKIGKPGERGAFLVQNSFGTSWPPSGSGSAAAPGRAYWSYNSFATTQFMAAVAYQVADDLSSKRLQPTMVTAPVASVVRSYQWTPRSDDKSVYLIVRLAFSDPLFLSQVRLKEPGGTSFEVQAVYGQSIRTGYVYLKRTDGKAFLSGRYKLTLTATTQTGAAVTYTGNVKIKKMKKAKSWTGTTMQGAAVTGPTGALVTSN